MRRVLVSAIFESRYTFEVEDDAPLIETLDELLGEGFDVLPSDGELREWDILDYGPS